MYRGRQEAVTGLYYVCIWVLVLLTLYRGVITALYITGKLIDTQFVPSIMAQ